MADGNIISVQGLCNSFGDQIIHKDLDLDVRQGEILGVVGGSRISTDLPVPDPPSMSGRGCSE